MDPIESDLKQDKKSEAASTAPFDLEFDVRKKWPQCDFLIQDIGKCKGAEIFQSELEVLSFRYCIKGKPIHLSLQHIISCDKYNYGCLGAYVDRSWEYIEKDGLVSEKCFPFKSNTETTPYCPAANECPNKGAKYELHKCKPGSVRRFTEEKRIKQELVENGPVMVMFDLRTDIMDFKEGIYVCKQNERVQMFYIVIGWGEENGQKYWLVLSARGKNPGENGLIKMRMGINCPKLAHAFSCEPDLAEKIKTDL